MYTLLLLSLPLLSRFFLLFLSRVAEILSFPATNTFFSRFYIKSTRRNWRRRLRKFIQTKKNSKDNDLNGTRPACHGHESARLPPIFVRWPIQSRFSKDPALQGVPSPFWTDTTARLDEPRRLDPNTTNINLSPSHAPLRH